MQLRLDRTSRVPLYRQLAEQLRRRILSGELPPGTRLPPERRLAATLGINRSTVVSAYRELAAAGLISGHVGRGTVVVDPAQHRESRAPAAAASPGRSSSLPSPPRCTIRRSKMP